MLPPAVARLVDTITREHAGQSVVFDADGTLWRGDVGEDFLRYAVRHREIIERFGRFPHRNHILGRISNAEELLFLAQPGSSF